VIRGLVERLAGKDGAQKKSGLVMHPPGNPAEPERIVKAFNWMCFCSPPKPFSFIIRKLRAYRNAAD
jgi:hypothetical protein